jgi:hypothetical protein
VGIYKKYVDVIARFYEDGRIIPLAIWWAEGQLYEIDRVLDVRPAASLKAGGAGIRYTCRIQGHEKYIWREQDRWFVEAKECADSS